VVRIEQQHSERRLTAILCADVVSYSRLMGRDEAGTLSALKRDRKQLIIPKLGQYHGRVVKLMGDGALIEFVSVVDAVRFAVEVQCGFQKRNTDVPEERRIVYRVGINIGDIMVDGDDIYGDGVNIAARLQELAEPGGICLARNVVDQIKGKLNLGLEPLGKPGAIAKCVSRLKISFRFVKALDQIYRIRGTHAVTHAPHPRSVWLAGD
jgi:adenylate cyclase